MKNKPYRYWLYLLARGFIGFVRLLPRRLALALAAGIGSLSFDLLKKEREKTLSHLRFAYGNVKSNQEIARIGREVFVNCAKSGVDWILYPRFSRANWNKIVHWNDEFQKVDQLLAAGKGLIMVSGHFGNWEYLASTFTVHGYPGCVIGRRIYYEPYNQLIVNTRLSKGVETYYREDSPKAVLRALKGNQILGIVADQDVDSIDGIFVPFFDHPAYTPVGPAVLSLATGAPIVPGFMIRQPDDSYQMILDEPIFPNPDAPRSDEIERITRLWNAAIEKYIRLYPEQWVWMHRRWKTKLPAAGNFKERK
ncbi:MAG: lysophospholipid acyltransferase family protein [Candidatus Omnitrophica bacterium]|nr:lysophospholipid acyltransferase family protein [Candidatus Omnitrophota bacterium]